jgi:hypothetical protein
VRRLFNIRVNGLLAVAADPRPQTAVSTAKEDVISMLQTRERIDNSLKREHEEFTGPASQ